MRVSGLLLLAPSALEPGKDQGGRHTLWREPLVTSLHRSSAYSNISLDVFQRRKTRSNVKTAITAVSLLYRGKSSPSHASCSIRSYQSPSQRRYGCRNGSRSSHRSRPGGPIAVRLSRSITKSTSSRTILPSDPKCKDS